MKRYCGNCGAQRNEGAEFCGQCGQPLAAAPETPQRGFRPRAPSERPAPGRALHKPRKGPRLVAGLALLALAAVVAIVLVRRDRLPDTGLGLTALASQVVQPSGGPQTVTAADRVSVTLPGGLLSGPEELTISEVASLPASSDQLYEPGHAYDISLGELHEISQPITIEVKYDAARLSPDMPADAQVRLATWDPVAGAWSLLPTTVDSARQVAIARLDHLSIVGDRYFHTPGYDHYEPLTDRYDQFPHIRLIWDTKAPVRMELPERRPGTFEYQNKFVAVHDITTYAMYAAAEAERAYKLYVDKQFVQESKDKVDLVVGMFTDRWGRQPPDETHPLGGAILLRNDHADVAKLRQVVSHEMFHIVQLQHAMFGAFSGDTMFWFTEASAEYASCRVAWADVPYQAGVPKPVCVMGEGIKNRFLRQSLQYRVSGSDADPDNDHLYHASHLLDYLISSPPYVGEPKSGDNVARFRSIWGAMMQQLLRTPGRIDAVAVLRDWAGRGELASTYERFAAYFLFNTQSPMPAVPANQVPTGAWGAQKLPLMLSDAEVASDRIVLPGRYSAAPWEVVVQTDPAKPAREVTVEVDGGLPEGVYLDVYLTATSEQRKDYGRWGGPTPGCYLPSTSACTIAVSEPNTHLNIVVANTSDPEVSLVIRVKAAPEPKVSPTKVPGTGRCMCDDGLPLTCDPAYENTADGFVLQVDGWLQTELAWCYWDCLEKCGCDRLDSDLTCAHTCICGP